MKMKRIAQFLILPLLLAGVFAGPALAINPVEGTCTGSASGSAICDAKSGNGLLGGNGLITRIAQTLVYFAGIVSVISLTVGGFQYITSNGDPGGIKTAKNTVMYALVGVVIAIFAQAIVTFVLKKL